MSDKKLISLAPRSRWFLSAPAAFVIFMFIFMSMMIGRPGAEVSLLLCSVFAALFLLFFHFDTPIADEVYDCGDFLLVRHKGQERKVPLAQIVSVKRNHFGRHSWLDHSCILQLKLKDGTKICFASRNGNDLDFTLRMRGFDIKA